MRTELMKRERLLRKREAMARLTVSRPTLDRMIKSGELEAIRISRRVVRIRESELERLIRGA